MTTLLDALVRIASAVLRLLAWVLTAVLALGLLSLALVLLLVGLVWALLRGRRPVVPVVVGRFTRTSAQRIWPGRAGWCSTRSSEVVDVEVTEVGASAGSRPKPGGDRPGIDGPDAR
jgi:hypothetical protein